MLSDTTSIMIIYIKISKGVQFFFGGGTDLIYAEIIRNLQTFKELHPLCNVQILLIFYRISYGYCLASNMHITE